MTTRSDSRCSRHTGLFAFRYWLVLGLCLLPFLAVPAQAAPVRFNIPAQPAVSALPLFIDQANTPVMFNREELKAVRTKALTGDFEVEAALTMLLHGSGFAGQRNGAGTFVVTRGASATGSVEGTLRSGVPGKAITGVIVSVRETGETTAVTAGGVYKFPALSPGTYTLIAAGEGFSRLRITDVIVRAATELVLGPQEMPAVTKGGEVQTMKEVVVSARKDIETLAALEVSESKVKPFTTANMDIPRTINDAQPYYIFDAKTVDQSGATNVEDFLKQRLTMNTAALTNGQGAGTNTQGNISAINLRGVGTDKTLILINGRRAAGVMILGADYQPDLNGIPLSAIDRIEVLPSSASGIYGGSAIGGVVNVILKKDYTGGEVRATYDNTWNSDAPKRTASVSFGTALEGGKTHLSLNASWSDAHPLLLQDRREVFEANIATVLRNAPSFIAANAWLGRLPNITAVTRGTTATPLILKNGGSLNSPNSFVPAGTGPGTSLATLSAGLLANAGLSNLELPATTQGPTGLLRAFGVNPKTRSFQGSVRRQMLPRVEAYAEFSYNENYAYSTFNPFNAALTVPINAPTNPFTAAVGVRFPNAAAVPATAKSNSKSIATGLIAHLPWEWVAALDYTWSESRFNSLNYNTDAPAVTADLTTGALNPFVDTLLYPLALQKYLRPTYYGGSSQLHDLALRASGPLAGLPWGKPTLTVGLEHRFSHVPSSTYEINYPITLNSGFRYHYYQRDAATDSIYTELTFPLIKQDWLPLIHSLDLQLSGRSERYEVDVGTPFELSLYQRTPVPPPTYGSPTLNGAPYFAKADYTSHNYTLGLKYQPIADVTLRASYATAFLPPSPAQLLTDPVKSTTTTSVNDPVTGQTGVQVFTLGGGNPDLKPQNSESVNGGIIWEPHWTWLKGLRLNAEYYKIEQFDAISTLGAQNVVNQQSRFPGRVTRDASGTITLVDNSMVNLFHRESEGWDLSADYTLRTGIGRFNLRVAESILLHLKDQYSQTLPEFEAAGFSPGESGAPKYKSNATLTWNAQRWMAGWTFRHFSSYKQYGAAGGPNSIQSYGGGPYTFYLDPQGGDTISAQTYHDLFLSYSFGEIVTETPGPLHAFAAKLLSGFTVQLGIRNVFDKVPPFDVFYANNYYLSPFGDTRLRSYWLSVRKAF